MEITIHKDICSSKCGKQQAVDWIRRCFKMYEWYYKAKYEAYYDEDYFETTLI